MLLGFSKPRSLVPLWEHFTCAMGRGADSIGWESGGLCAMGTACVEDPFKGSGCYGEKGEHIQTRASEETGTCFRADGRSQDQRREGKS